MEGMHAHYKQVAREEVRQEVYQEVRQEERQLMRAIIREYNLSGDPEKAAKAGGVSVVEAEEFLLGCGFPIAKTSRP